MERKISKNTFLIFLSFFLFYEIRISLSASKLPAIPDQTIDLAFFGAFTFKHCIGCLLFSKLEHKGRRRGIIDMAQDAMDGLQYFDVTQFLVIFFILCFAMLLASAIIYHDNKSTKMIVGIEEDYENKKITIFTKDFLDKVRRVNIPLSEFKIELGGRQKDGLSKHGHICFEFKRRREVMGRYFINYFVWNDEKAIHEIMSKLNQPLSNPPLRSSK